MVWTVLSADTDTGPWNLGKGSYPYDRVHFAKRRLQPQLELQGSTRA